MLIKDHLAPAGGPSDYSGSVPLFWWQGWSSRWHLTTVYRLASLDCRERGAFLLVRPEADGSRTPLLLGMANNIADDLYDVHGAATLQAIRAGATEAHVHLAADYSWQDEEVIRDIAAGWQLGILRPIVYA